MWNAKLQALCFGSRNTRKIVWLCFGNEFAWHKNKG